MKSVMHTNEYGDKFWRSQGYYHREDGPAIERENGEVQWYHFGLRHREDGPAIEFINGHKEWWLDGIEYTNQEYKKRMRYLKLKQLLR